MRIHELLQLSMGSPDEAWLAEARQLVEHEASLVGEFLALGQRPVYGFTTHLGPKDGDPAVHNADLINEHVLGSPRKCPALVGRLMAGCLVARLGNGGSGVAPEVFEEILESLGTRTDWRLKGAWFSSYGSGDVVPAAWLAREVAPITSRGNLPGTAIALMNGHHVSTAMSVVSVVGAISAGTRMWGHVVEVVDRLGGVPPEDLVNGERGGFKIPQLPVSLRDPSPAWVEFQTASQAVIGALEGRLSAPSSNPLWVNRGGQFEPISQASFLDFSVTMGLRRLRSALGIVAVTLKNSLDEARRREWDGVLVQHPKVAHAVVDRGFSSTRSDMWGCEESGGVEDLRDFSLIEAVELGRSVTASAELAHLAGVLPLNQGVVDRAWDVIWRASGASRDAPWGDGDWTAAAEWLGRA